MREIAKVSDITAEDVTDYLRIEDVDENELNTINDLMKVAKNYISKYTGQDDLDDYPDFVIVVLVLVQDMYDNRTMYVDGKNVNQIVQNILDMHSVNLL